jgi:hypothetical protein
MQEKLENVKFIVKLNYYQVKLQKRYLSVFIHHNLTQNSNGCFHENFDKFGLAPSIAWYLFISQ